MATPPAAGLYPPIPTFFKKDNWTLDLDTQIAHIKFLHENGIPGATVNGSTGENAHLTREERVKIISEIRKAVPSFTIIAGVCEHSIDGAVAEIAAAKQAGANFALVVCSSYFGGITSQQGIYNWYSKLADQATLPIMIYLFPGVSNGIVIQADTFEKLAAHPNIVGAKFTYTDLSLFVKVNLNPKVQASNFTVFPGFANFLLPAFSVKSGGLIDGLGNAFPKAINQLLEYGLKGDFGKEAQELQYKVALAEQICVDGGVPATKALIKHFTGFGETLCGRAPLDVEYSTDLFAAKYLTDIEPLASVEKAL
ncbi:hypothetical protein DASC09_009870 [Saccharomycopsis crataegensis]|uniref:Aldolase n=1 Tax=Saccharomycopsis crataegensis TaxID=43959 RepID=A0AAV5QGD9_9ASCO|nr:hypothetical protein DASC09_009870 [Saccharomycopsis crataegensis]